MSLKIYNSQSRSKEEFKPLNPPEVKMYVCGITVYDYCHLGHARAAVVFDMIFRYLKHKGYQVTYVRNFTDIDDKIIKRAQESGRDWREITHQFIEAFNEDMSALGNLEPSFQPRATDYIEQMQQMILTLEKNGLAYASAGDVFFAVQKFPSYGSLANKNIEDLASGARIEIQESKKDPLDFALWKAAKPGEPKWPSPWGEGRPGWHIECSVMSTQLLGPTLDIHGGGRDLIFPHHENERAQSEGTYQKTFARYWIHNGFVNLNTEKMSKSTGNFMTIRDVLKKYPAEVVRFFLLSSHYRSPIDFTEQNLEEAGSALERVYQTFHRFFNYQAMEAEKDNANSPQLETGFSEQIKTFQKSFDEAMDDDFNTALAIGKCFDLVRDINRFLDQKPSQEKVKESMPDIKTAIELVSDCLGVFGQNPAAFLEKLKEQNLQLSGLNENLIEEQIQKRIAAKKNKDFALADQIRDELSSQGILLKDHPDGKTSWSVK